MYEPIGAILIQNTTLGSRKILLLTLMTLKYTPSRLGSNGEDFFLFFSYFFFLLWLQEDEDKGIVTENHQSPQVPWCLKDEPNILLNAFLRMCLIYEA